MNSTCPISEILAHQHAFADRVATIRNVDDLTEFVDDVNDWLQRTAIANCVSPNVLEGRWTERLKIDPLLVSDPERQALAEEIRAWQFGG
jgi:hypothetical protein